MLSSVLNSVYSHIKQTLKVGRVATHNLSTKVAAFAISHQHLFGFVIVAIPVILIGRHLYRQFKPLSKSKNQEDPLSKSKKEEVPLTPTANSVSSAAVNVLGSSPSSKGCSVEEPASAEEKKKAELRKKIQESIEAGAQEKIKKLRFPNLKIEAEQFALTALEQFDKFREEEESLIDLNLLMGRTLECIQNHLSSSAKELQERHEEIVNSAMERLSRDLLQKLDEEMEDLSNLEEVELLEKAYKEQLKSWVSSKDSELSEALNEKIVEKKLTLQREIWEKSAQQSVNLIKNLLENNESFTLLTLVTVIEWVKNNVSEIPEEELKSDQQIYSDLRSQVASIAGAGEKIGSIDFTDQQNSDNKRKLDQLLKDLPARIGLDSIEVDLEMNIAGDAALAQQLQDEQNRQN